MLYGKDDSGESRMGEISMSGSTRERAAAVIGLMAFHPVLSSLLYWLNSVTGIRRISAGLGQWLRPEFYKN